MPAVSAIIRYGTIPSASLLDESNPTTPDILVQSLTTSGSREMKDYRNADGNIFGLEYRNPIITFAFDGYITSKTATLANATPGATVTALANFTINTFGFAPGDGVMVYTDPVRSESNEEIAKTTFTVTQYPFVSAV
jgi:hypothetical protein